MRVACLVVLSLLIVVPAAGQGRQQGDLPKYQDSPGGLKDFIRDTLTAVNKNDAQSLTAHVNALVLLDPGAWFKATFGEERGTQFANAYSQQKDKLPASLTELFQGLANSGLSDVQIHRYDKSCDPDANSRQYPVLAARQRQTPLYEARVLSADGSRGRLLWFFVYADGGFRYAGMLRVPAIFPPRDPEGAIRIRVLPDEQKAKLAKHAEPKYPQQAKDANVQGTVRLMALIAPDGSIRLLDVEEGTCWLAESALKAVREWRYQPTVVNGQPAEVITTIEVAFTLK